MEPGRADWKSVLLQGHEEGFHMKMLGSMLFLVAALQLTLAPAGGVAQKSKPLGPKELEALWKQLAGPPEDAYKAVLALIEVPDQAIPFLRKRILPRAPVKAERLKQLLRELDSDQKKVADAAFKELERLREQAGRALREFLRDDKVTKAGRERAEKLLDLLQEFKLPPEELREWRALEVLERIGSTQARGVLEGLAKGAPGTWLTEEASAAVERLRRRQGGGDDPAKKPPPKKESKPATDPPGAGAGRGVNAGSSAALGALGVLEGIGPARVKAHRGMRFRGLANA